MIQISLNQLNGVPSDHKIVIFDDVNMKIEQNREASEFPSKIPDIFSITVCFPAFFIGKVYNFPAGHSKMDT